MFPAGGRIGHGTSTAAYVLANVGQMPWDDDAKMQRWVPTGL